MQKYMQRSLNLFRHRKILTSRRKKEQQAYYCHMKCNQKPKHYKQRIDDCKQSIFYYHYHSIYQDSYKQILKEFYRQMNYRIYINYYHFHCMTDKNDRKPYKLNFHYHSSSLCRDNLIKRLCKFYDFLSRSSCMQWHYYCMFDNYSHSLFEYSQRKWDYFRCSHLGIDMKFEKLKIEMRYRLSMMCQLMKCKLNKLLSKRCIMNLRCTHQVDSFQ